MQGETRQVEHQLATLGLKSSARIFVTYRRARHLMPSDSRTNRCRRETKHRVSFAVLNPGMNSTWVEQLLAASAKQYISTHAVVVQECGPESSDSKAFDCRAKGPGKALLSYIQVHRSPIGFDCLLEKRTRMPGRAPRICPRSYHKKDPVTCLHQPNYKNMSWESSQIIVPLDACCRSYCM